MAKRPRPLTIGEQEALLNQFYEELEDERDPTVVLGEFIGENENIDFDIMDESESDDEPDNLDGINDEETVVMMNEENVNAPDPVDMVEIQPEEDLLIPEEVNEPIIDAQELPRKQNFFGNLEMVLNEDNYDSIPNQNRKKYAYKDSKNTVNITWSTVKEDNSLGSKKRPSANILKHRPGNRGRAKQAKTPHDAFLLFFTKEMIKNIVAYTNSSISNFQAEFPDLFTIDDKRPHMKPVDEIDIKAFLGILYARAALRVNLMSMVEIWGHESANDIFAATMSQMRFKFISRFITFDDKATRNDRWKHDKFACMRELFEAFNLQCATTRYPTPYLAIDETLYPYRGRIGFKQYNPSKPAKYGLLFRSLCDAVKPFTYYSLPYAGKPDDVSGEAKKYYVSGTDEYTKYLVNGFCLHNDIAGCNISMDRYFTSVSLAEWALAKKFTIVGTMRLDRKGIPKDLKPVGNREERSTVYMYQQPEEKTMLVSYVDKKKAGKKNVIILTSMHETVKVTRDQRRKPQVHTFYDHTKGGVDVVDLISCMHSTRIKSKRWPINVLAFLLDTARTNAKTILNENGIEKSNFHFTWELGKALCMPSIQRRYNQKGIQIGIIQKIRRVLGIKEVNRGPGPLDRGASTSTGRCGTCVAELVSTPHYRERERLNHRLKLKCEVCGVFLCKAHQFSKKVVVFCEDHQDGADHDS